MQTSKSFDLSQKKLSLLQAKIAGRDPDRILRRTASGVKPLSFAQHRLLFLSEFLPDTRIYNVPVVCRFGGVLNAGVLERSLNEVVRRHDSLRTSFARQGGDPVQVVAESLHIPLKTIDLSGTPEAEREAEALRIARAEAREPFDLSRGPLLRTTLLQLTEQEHWLLLSMHHIITDGWSVGVVLRELASVYEALLEEREVSLPELAIQYSDFAQWQREWLRGEVLEQQLGFWKERLKGLTPLQLPTDKPRPAVRSFDGRRVYGTLPRALVKAINALAQREGVTLYMTLLAAFTVLLQRYSGQDDIAVGTPIANRNRGEIEGLVGFFVNTLVMRTDVSGDPSFRELLGRVRETTLGAYAHQDLPFEKLVEELHPERDMSQTPLFQVMFAVQNAPVSIERFSGVTVSCEDTDLDTAKFDLTLSVVDWDRGRFGIEYSSDLLEQSSVERMVGHLENLLAGIVADPEQRVSELPLLGEQERRRMVVEWNATARQYPSERCVHELFEAQAERTPDAVALEYEGQCLTYAELNRRANQLAHYLRGLGVGPEVLVGLCLERGFEMIVALVGVLKAGGAYVPLDPAYPAERLRYMLDDSSPMVLLTQGELKGLFPGLKKDLPILDLTAASPAWRSQLETDLDRSVVGLTPEHLAYVIYTSGSTGTPKGVMVEHANVTRLFTTTDTWIHFSQDDIWTFFHSYAFDFSVWEIWGALLYGSRLVIVPSEIARSPDDFYALVCQSKVTILNQTPSAFRQLIAAQSKSQEVHQLRQVIFGGEALDVATLKPWYRQNYGHRTQLINMYGITETTVHVTCQPLEQADVNSPGGSSIGRRIPDLRIYILDKHKEPVPVGVAGELYIGGAGVTRGYLKRPELTAECFVPERFVGDGERKMYKTGDLGRWRSDGNIEFLGRNDSQVKIRGFRVELGEIEVRLAEFEGVREVVVLAREDTAGDRRLVAYIVPDEVHALPLRQMLRLREMGDLTDCELYELPNGMLVSFQNKAETDFLYREIFENESYLRHGIVLDRDACVFDVGANIGVFSLFVAQRAPTAVVYAFEPIPAIFESLRINMTIYQRESRLFNCGLARESGTTQFTWYRHNSVLSGRYADPREEQLTVKSFLRGQTGTENLSDEALDKLLEERLEGEPVTCQLRTLSSIIAEEGIERIDLLKVDVEKSELDVLLGIETHDWHKIHQIVVEVHGSDGRLATIVNLLKSHGYELHVEQDDSLKTTNLYNIYARRAKSLLIVNRSGSVSPRSIYSAAAYINPGQLITALRSYLKSRLPEYMVPAAFVMLDAMPLTANGKLDRKRLPVPEADAYAVPRYEGPRSAIEETLAGLWVELLRVSRIGIYDNWFDLGGHSLLGMQLISRVRDAFQIELPVRSLFEEPTVVGLGRRVEAALRSGELAEAPPIERVVGSARIPVSFAQQRILFLNELVTDNPFYNVAAPVRVTGPLDSGVLERSLNEVVRRHDSLRTSFARQGGDPVQVVAESLHIPLKTIDLSGTPEAEREAEALRIARAEAREPFDLSRGPLLRTTLLQLTEQEHWLLLSMHHIITDGWSVGVVLRELASVYEALLEEREVSLPELAIQYSDFAQWQREWLRGEVLEQQLGFWKERLKGLTPLQLPTDKPRPAVRTYSGAILGWEINPTLTGGLEALSRREGVTLYMTLLAAFTVLLQRYSGQDDIAVGTPIANRNRGEIEGLVGFFVNTLVMRTDVSGDPSFRELLGRVRETTLGAYAHQDLPFEKLVEELHPERDMSQTPLFQVVFAMQNFALPTFTTGGLKLAPVELDTGTAKFDLTWFVMPLEGGGLRGSLEYSTELLEQSSVERMVGHLENLLAGIVADPEQRVSELPLLGEQERRRMVVEWNATARQYPSERCVHELFEAQAERTPDAVALEYEGQCLTYAELNRRANQLAHYLRGLGVGPEVLVGLCLERSLEMVIGLLGILKAGGAYVPLDPSYPSERLEFMLRDAQTQILVTQRRLQEKRPGDRATVYLDEDWPAIAAASDTNPANATLPGNLAYVIYTSGSTGTPKGVGIHHCGLVNLMQCHNTIYQVTSQDRASLFSAIGFDGAGWEIWPYLQVGASVHMMDEFTRMSAPTVHEFLLRNRITIAFLPPVLSEELLDRPWPKHGTLRALLTGGDRVVLYPNEDVEFEYWNHYGPTEATVTATRGKVDARLAGQGLPVIGQPLDNFRIFVLDKHLQPVPPLVAGELYIAGIGLARGYLYAADLTAEKFIPSPYFGKPGERMYRTGDVARFRPDGTLDFLGRNDRQVKLRGFRIELGEIQAALKTHPSIRDAIAVLTEVSSEKTIVGYVIPLDPARPPACGDLREFLRARLPTYMIPAIFISLDDVPLTRNGKIDTAMLPLPEPLSASVPSETLTSLEQELVKIWCGVLEVKKVGLNENFFGIGGHSLLASLVILRIQEVFGVTVPLRTIFDAPTIAELSIALGVLVSESHNGDQLSPSHKALLDA